MNKPTPEEHAAFAPPSDPIREAWDKAESHKDAVLPAKLPYDTASQPTPVLPQDDLEMFDGDVTLETLEEPENHPIAPVDDHAQECCYGKPSTNDDASCAAEKMVDAHVQCETMTPCCSETIVEVLAPVAEEAVVEAPAEHAAGDAAITPVVSGEENETEAAAPAPDLRGARIGVVTFPGTLDDHDALRAVRLCGAEPVKLWHADADLKDVDAIVLPGGFSYGDYLRAGAIARFAPVMEKIIEAAHKGMPVLGICNGFQVLCESHLLPGALVRNDRRTFVCREQKLRVESSDTVWTNQFQCGEEIIIVLKHADGQYVADAETLAALEANDQVVFRYLDGNPNGSMNDIAGVTNERGNVVGLMPHPEHNVEEGVSPNLDGIKFFTSALAFLGKAIKT